MPVETILQKRSGSLLGSFLLVVTIASTAFALQRGVPADVVFGGLCGAGVFVFLFLRAPQALLVGAIFMPQWKDYWPLSSVDRVVDLTLVMLAGLLVCLLCRVLAQIGRLDEIPLLALFYGQGALILAFAMFAACVAGSFLYTPA